MRKLNLSALAVVTALLSACNAPPIVGAPTEDVEILKQIQHSVQRATDAQVRLAAMKGSNRGLLEGETNAAEGLDAPVSISWTGPIDRLAEKIAELSGLEYGGAIGTKPPGEVMVSINANNEKGRLILLNANGQAGLGARVEVVEGGKKIIVRYPPTTRTGGYPVAR